MIKLYTKVDKNLLKKHPFHWIIGWHKFLPIIAILLLFSIVIGFMFPTTTYNYSYRNSGLDTASIFLGFVSFMAFILYVIRQIKYNSFRIHHHIPFKKSIFVFFSFWLMVFLFTSIPFIPHHIHTWRVKNKINSITDDFKKDTKILYEGSVFFASKYYNVVDNNYNEETQPTKKHRQKRTHEIVFNNENVTINSIPHQFGYYHYKDNYKAFKLPITISNKESLNRIKNFITVAEKYNIKLLEKNPQEVFNKRKAFNQQKNKVNFTLFTIDKAIAYPNKAVNNYTVMMSNYKRQFNKSFEIYEVLGILIFSILFAVLLWIVISVPIADFGYSILVSVILMVFMGIITVMFDMIFFNDFVIRLAFYIMIFIVYSLAFMSKKETRLYRVLKIVSHYLVAVFLFLLFLEIDEVNIFNHQDEFYVFSALFLTGMVISVFLFKQVYKNYRLLPK